MVDNSIIDKRVKIYTKKGFYYEGFIRQEDQHFFLIEREHKGRKETSLLAKDTINELKIEEAYK